MTGLAFATCISLGVWLLILTLVVVLLVRQIGLLTVHLSMSRDTFSFANDGPEVGSHVPGKVLDRLSALGASNAHILLLSANCSPCRELANVLRKYQLPSTMITLLAGRAELADSLASLLPSTLHIVRDPLASELAEALAIKSTPFALAVEGGIIRKKAYIYHPDNIGTFLGSPDTKKAVVSAPPNKDDEEHLKEIRYAG